ncbi:hypothetical protein FRB94_002411 [Tulasnella sp. JGI-2019a]|nr:hypothetical protein FRB94_002411 [Tulasnella sp. JGI-2019a]
MPIAFFSPGLTHLFHNSPPFLETAALYFFIRYVNKIRPIHLLSYLTGVHGHLIAYASLHLLKGLFKAIWSDVREGRDRIRLGARKIPGLKGGKLPGNIDILHWLVSSHDKDYPGGTFVELRRRNGDLFCLDLLWGKSLWTDNPHYIKEVLTMQAPNFIKGTSFKGSFDSVLGDGIFNSDGDTWRFHRSMTRPFFTRDRVTDFDIFDHHTETILNKINERCQTGMPVDFQEAISQFTMESATEFLFGRSFGVLKPALRLPGGTSSSATPPGGAGIGQFTRAFTSAMEHIATRNNEVGPWQLREIFGDRTKADMKMIYDVVDPIIDAALRSKMKAAKLSGDTSQEGVDGNRETLLSHLVSETEDREMIRDELLNILLAGRDTTASNLTFTVYFLAMHPPVLDRLRKEIMDVIGPTEQPGFEHIKDMKYLRAVINESLRLLLPVPFDIKTSVKSTVLTDPTTGVRHYIPTKAPFIWSTLSMHRSVELWGPDAIQFDPDRWLDERNKKYYLENPFIFLPFLAGPRICLGQQFAYNEISFFLIRFLQRFWKVELAPDGQPMGSLPPAEWKEDVGTRKPIEKIWPKSHVTMYCKGGLWVRAQ